MGKSKIKIISVTKFRNGVVVDFIDPAMQNCSCKLKSKRKPKIKSKKYQMNKVTRESPFGKSMP